MSELENDTEEIRQAIMQDPLLEAVYQFAVLQTNAHYWRGRGAHKRQPDAYRAWVLDDLEKSTAELSELFRDQARVV